MEPERTEIVYYVRYFDSIRRRRVVTTYKLTEAEARQRYGDIELVQASREERKVSGDPLRQSTGRFNPGTPGYK